MAGLAPAFAGVGTTSAGVTTIDPNNPSTNVQQQSSDFVAANQQLQNGAASGIALPGNVGSDAQAGGHAGTGSANASGAQSGQPGEHGAAAEQHAEQHAPPPPPAAPPPPPPTYESKMRPVSQATTVTPAPTPPVTAAPAASHAAPAPATPPAPVKPSVVPKPKQDPAPAVAKAEIPPAPAATADPGGGRGSAPDGYTFWLGLLIAGALLALAAVTYLRIQRGESPG